VERLRIALIRGDGIGPELVDAALRVLEAVGETDGLEFAYTEVNAGAGAYRETGTEYAPEDVELMRTGVDATLKGPVGLPDVRHPDGTEAGLLGGILRTGLQVYANVRPVLQLPGAQGRLVGHEPGSIDVFDRRYTPTAEGERRVPSDRFTREPAPATDRAALRR